MSKIEQVEATPP